MCIHHKETTVKTLRELADAIDRNECPKDALLYVVNSLLGVVELKDFTDEQGHTFPIAYDINEDAIYHSIEDPWDEEPGDVRQEMFKQLKLDMK